MARRTDNQPITTRAARDRLAPRHEPYWRGLDDGTAAGYRKTASGGWWYARTRVEGRYQKGAIGRPDDALGADGVETLDYRQATTSAKEWATGQHHAAAGLGNARERRAPYTVADAMRHYMNHYSREGGKAADRTQQVIDAHIITALGTVRLDRLTQHRVEVWRDALADAPARLRTSKTATKQRFREIDPDDAEAKRRRRSTTNRVLTVLKAALKFAVSKKRAHTNAAWAKVKPFRKADAPKVRYLTDAETVRLANACPADLRQIVTAALLSGMRYGEFAGMRARDFNAETGVVAIPVSKSGDPRHVVLTDEGRAFFVQAIAGRVSDAVIFTRQDGLPWGKSHQFRPLRDASDAANISPAVGFHILRHTYGSRLAMAGTPMAVIAQQLGHKDTRMTEKHYAHLASSYVADTVRANFAPLGIVQRSNAEPIRA